MNHRLDVVRSEGRAPAARAKARDGAPSAPRAAPRAAARGSRVALCLAPFLSYKNSGCDGAMTTRRWVSDDVRRRCRGLRGVRPGGWRSVASPRAPGGVATDRVRPDRRSLN